MRRYYPALESIGFGPTVFGLLVAIPALKRTGGMGTAMVLFAAAFVIVFACWRWFLRVEVVASQLRGRDPILANRVVLEFSAITRVREGEFELGRIKGWIFEAGPSQAVFVSKQALLDPALKNVFERLAKGSQ